MPWLDRPRSAKPASQTPQVACSIPGWGAASNAGRCSGGIISLRLVSFGTLLVPEDSGRAPSVKTSETTQQPNLAYPTVAIPLLAHSGRMIGAPMQSVGARWGSGD